MQAGRTRDKKYMEWVRESPCCICESPYSVAHHLIGHGQGGMATKASDLFTMPLCGLHHDELHRGVLTWEQKYGNQVYHLARIMLLAIASGIKTKDVFLREIDNNIINQLDRDMFNEWLE